jgi:Rieske 2Fe-2S family protein
VYIVAHVDYVRTVRVLPVGAERTRLTIDWLVRPETLADSEVEVERLAEFGRQVVLEDGAVCEANQAGLHCREHQQGILMPNEYGLAAFYDWVRERLATAEVIQGRS